ncbi:MAG: GrpB family protein [Sphingobacteriales bacterium]|nr:MAG: GrpB family protein [Sphingobacteriales bacterium]
MLIVKYTPKWVKDFEDIKSEIDRELRGLQFTIEHVGSTAVPNLDSKPIIDIDIIYSKQSDFEQIKWRLLTVGYFHNGDQGIQDREVFKRTGNCVNGVLDTIKHHLYVCPINSEALHRHILSRNFLRKNDWAKLKYQEMKYALAEQAGQDGKLYAALQELTVNDFIDSIVKEEQRAADRG